VSYRKNLFAVTAASFIGFTGFTLVMPFLPLYFQQLGVTDVGQVALWSGVSLGVTPAITALMAPFWGRLADRYGRKVMVERSLISFVIVMAAMAFVTQAWHVFALRALQGLFAGYGALTLAMAADSAPRDRMGHAIGFVQTAQRLGPALGPIIGGVIAQMAGLRRGFLVTAVFYVFAVLLVQFMYQETVTRHEPAAAASGRVTFRNVLAFQNFLLLMGVIFGLQFIDRSFGPVLPLFVSELGTPPDNVTIVSGMLFSLASGAGALGHQFCGGLLRRASVRAVIAGSAAAGAAGTLVYVLSDRTALLFVGTPIFGAAVGVATTAAYTAAASVIPPGVRGAGFGVLSTASLAGLALSPVFNGLLAATSIRAIFVVDTIGMLALAALVSRLMMTTPLPETTAPATEEL
jgi:DHA1 family multidrug resistance protein-like MFS transporter